MAGFNEIKSLMEAMEKLKHLHMFRMNMQGLNRGEFSMLMSVYEKGNCNCGDMKVSDLAELHKTSMPAISQMLNLLEKKGMIERRPSQTDRRVVCIELTDQGEETLDAAFEQFMSFVTKVVSRLGEEDTRMLIELFSRLYAIIEEISNEDNTGENV